MRYSNRPQAIPCVLLIMLVLAGYQFETALGAPDLQAPTLNGSSDGQPTSNPTSTQTPTVQPTPHYHERPHQSLNYLTPAEVHFA